MRSVVALLVFAGCAMAAYTGQFASTSQCTMYCDAYNTTCTQNSLAADNYPIFSTYQACMDECAKFPLTDSCVGQAPGCGGAGAENSWDCRYHHVLAGPTFTPPAIFLHCIHGTPLSWNAEDLPGINTGPCLTDSGNATVAHALLDDLCNNIVGSCGAYLTTSIDTCRAAMRYVPGIDNVQGDPAYPTEAVPFPIRAPNAPGNNFACRRYHVWAAATDPVTHCPHAISGHDACGSDCDFYCGLIQGVCVGGNKQYTDATTCLSQCAKIATGPLSPDGMNPTTSGDNLGCRIYHASVAAGSTLAADVTAHCTHAGFKSTKETCGKSDAFTASASLLLVALLAFFSLN